MLADQQGRRETQRRQIGWHSVRAQPGTRDMAYAHQPPTNPPEPCKRRAVSLPRASGCCRFGQVTFAGMDRNGRDAPLADVSCRRI